MLPLLVGARHRWYLAGVVSVVLSYLLLIAVQIIKHDWLPPEISFSQYGVGAWGWLFSLFLVAFAAAPLMTERAVTSGRFVWALLVVGLFGCLVMALVPTDPGGLQESARARVHMTGSVFGLSMTPLGVAAALLRHRRVPPMLPILLAAVSTAAIALLLVSAAGVDTLGVGTVKSWAVWQTVAALADLVLVGLMGVAHRPLASASPPATSVPGGIDDHGSPLAPGQAIRNSDGADT